MLRACAPLSSCSVTKRVVRCRKGSAPIAACELAGSGRWGTAGGGKPIERPADHGGLSKPSQSPARRAGRSRAACYGRERTTGARRPPCPCCAKADGSVPCGAPMRSGTRPWRVGGKAPDPPGPPSAAATRPCPGRRRRERRRDPRHACSGSADRSAGCRSRRRAEPSASRPHPCWSSRAAPAPPLARRWIVVDLGAKRNWSAISRTLAATGASKAIRRKCACTIKIIGTDNR